MLEKPEAGADRGSGRNGAQVAAKPPIAFATGLAALVAAAFAMSISPSLVRLAEVGPFASAFWRVFLALPILYVWMLAAEKADPGRAVKSYSLGTILAGLAFAGDLLFWHLAIMKTSIANATFFATMAPLWVVIFGWLFLRQKSSLTVLSGLGLCLVGGAALVWQSLSVSPDHALGDLLAIITGVFFGLYFLCVGAARTTSSAARVTFELSVLSAAILLVAALVLGNGVMPQTATSWAVLICLAVVSHAGGQGLLSVALGRLPTVFSSLVIFAEAIAAALFAWLIFGETVSWLQAIGGLIILIGIWIARPRSEG